MGECLLSFLKCKATKERKIAFIVSLITGFLVHTYKFTNTLMCNDSLSNYYSSQDMIGSGRIFLKFACGMSSYFDLPWLIGVFSLVFIALTSVIITDIFEMKNPVLIAISSALLVSFPAITETFFFEFTADGYMLAMLLAAVSVKICRVGEKRVIPYIISALLLCVVCGIYQAYICFAMVLALTYFAWEILENRHSISQYIIWMIKNLVTYIAGLGIYYLSWKILLKTKGMIAYSYLGIDQVGNVGLLGLLKNIIEVPKKFLIFFLHYNIFENEITMWIALGLLFLILAFVAVLIALFNSKTIKNGVKSILFLLSVAFVPYASYIWIFSSPGIEYKLRMLQCISVFIIFIAVICDRWMKPSLSTLSSLVLVGIIINNSVSANIFYFYMNKCDVQTRATATELATRIHILDDGNVKYIAIYGSLNDWNTDTEYYDLFSKLTCFHKMEKSLLNSDYVYLYLRNEFDFKLSYYVENPDVEIPIHCFKNEYSVNDNDPSPFAKKWIFPVLDQSQRDKMRNNEVYKSMPCWPHADSVKVIGDTVVVKLSEQAD